MSWLEIEIKTTLEAKEAVTNILYEADVQGIVIEDPNDIINQNKNNQDWDYIDLSLLDNYYEGVIIKGYFEKDKFIDEKIKLIKEKVHMLPTYNLNIGLGKILTSDIENKDWNSEWKKYFKPIKLGKKVVIKPSWEEYKKIKDELVIEIDPGLGFGTGTHETTSMCIEELEKYINSNSTVFDIGTGTGILAITSAILGCKNSIGIDIDENCVLTAKENVKKNKVGTIVKIIKGNLLDTINTKADIIVANIIADIIIDIAGYIRNYLNDNGIFISSGILIEKIEEIKKVFKENNLEIISIKEKGEWACITAKSN